MDSGSRTREENTLRKRKWYRKRARDQNFRRQQQSSESDETDEGSPQKVCRGNVDSDESERPLSPRLESNLDHEMMPNDESVESLAAHEETTNQSRSDENVESDSEHGARLHGSSEDDDEGEPNMNQEGEMNLSDHELDLHSSGDVSDNEEQNRNGGGNIPVDDRYHGIQENAEYSGEESGAESSESNSHDSSEDEEEEEEDQEQDEQEEDNEDDEMLDLPLYNGSLITLKASLLAILTFILTHKLTGLCVSDLLSLIALHCGPNNSLVKSLYKFKKHFKMLGKSFINCHYFCSVCQVPLQNKNSVCDRGGREHTVEYFIEFPILSQLQSMFSRPRFHESLQFRFTRVKTKEENIEEIYDGRIYQQFMNSGFLADPKNLSFFMYFDGISLFKSSSFSIWPVYFTINELRYKLRTKRENTILAGLWFGKSKPNPNLFLKPMQESLLHWETNGQDLKLPNGQVIRVKAKLLGAVGDMPAKSLFMRFMQFNGAFSCFNCMAKGARFGLGNSTIQVFPYSRNIEVRTIENTNDYAAQALHARQNDPEASVYGIKGPSFLSAMLPNMIDCMAIDVMHGVFLGAMRTLLNLWFDGQHSNCPFSISGLLHIVDRRLKNIKPPSTFVRIPRSIKKDFKVLKASDLKIFFTHYSLVVLNGILPERYWFHHCKFVTAISLLCQESISHTNIDLAEDLLHSYVSNFEQLYGLRFMTLTFHQLIHLPSVVRNLGPAWVYSCFYYESLNGALGRLVHGSRYVALQICSSSFVFMRLPSMLNSMTDGDAKTFCWELLGRSSKPHKITENIDDKTGVVGKLKLCYPVPHYLRQLLVDVYNIAGGRYKYFNRLKRKGILYTSETYIHCRQRQSCFVEISDNNVPYLCKVKLFVKWSSCNYNCQPDCEDCPKRYFCIASLYERVVWELQDAPQNIIMSHINKVVPMDEIRAFPVHAIKQLCLHMSVDGDEYICQPVNNLEVE